MNFIIWITVKHSTLLQDQITFSLLKFCRLSLFLSLDFFLKQLTLKSRSKIVIGVPLTSPFLFPILFTHPNLPTAFSISSMQNTHICVYIYPLCSIELIFTIFAKTLSKKLSKRLSHGNPFFFQSYTPIMEALLPCSFLHNPPRWPKLCNQPRENNNATGASPEKV